MTLKLYPTQKPSSSEVNGMWLLLGEPARPLVPLMNGSVTARVHRDLLRRWLLPVLEDIRSYEQPSVIFQQANARIHCEAHTLRLRAICYPSRLIVPTSLTSIQSRTPGLFSNDKSTSITTRLATTLSPEKVKEKLAQILPLCWEKIPPKQFEAHWRSMPNRVKVVIETKGRYTRS